MGVNNIDSNVSHETGIAVSNVSDYNIEEIFYKGVACCT